MKKSNNEPVGIIKIADAEWQVKIGRIGCKIASSLDEALAIRDTCLLKFIEDPENEIPPHKKLKFKKTYDSLSKNATVRCEPTFSALATSIYEKYLFKQALKRNPKYFGISILTADNFRVEIAGIFCKKVADINMALEIRDTYLLKFKADPQNVIPRREKKKIENIYNLILAIPNYTLRAHSECLEFANKKYKKLVSKKLPQDAQLKDPQTIEEQQVIKLVTDPQIDKMPFEELFLKEGELMFYSLSSPPKQALPENKPAQRTKRHCMQ